MCFRRFALPTTVLALALLPGCGGNDDEGAPTAGAQGDSKAAAAERVEVDGGQALVWGDGPYGVVLAHGAAFDAASWEPQAALIARQGMVALAVEDISPESILAALEYLKAERGVEEVALLGGSAGADSILEAASQEPDAPDQLILLSANQAVDGLGSEPKLFIASGGEPVAEVSRELARTSPGDENEARILPGAAHAQNIFDTGQGELATRLILERLERFSGNSAGAALGRSLDVERAVERWAGATTLADAQAAAEHARNLITGPGVQGAGDVNGDGQLKRVAVGLLPGEDGSPGLASRLGGECVQRDVLGGDWSDPTARWAEVTRRIEAWAPDNNTFPELPSHAQRVVGWASLTLDADGLADAQEFSGHAAGHAAIVVEALRSPEASPCPGGS